MFRPLNRLRPSLCLMGLLFLPLTGCSLLESLHGVAAIPAHLVPPSYLARPRSDMLELSMTRLRQNSPDVYQLGPDDVLGVYIETVIGSANEPPPVHFPEDGSRSPAVGYPIPIREDGTVCLPLVCPIQVAGLTLPQATEVIRKAYTVDRKILPVGKDSIIVTLMRQRMHQVLVVREEGGGEEGNSKRGTGHVVDLPAYKNDLLHALNATGGLPGLDADNEILIFHGMFEQGAERDELLAEINAGRDPCLARPIAPDDPNMVRIPLRFYPEQLPDFSEKDIILVTGDIVLIKARDRERFYTGGALPGGAHTLPRDYDLDVLGGIALAGGALGNSGIGLSQAGSQNRGSGGRNGNYAGGVAPSQAIILREVQGGQQVPIRIDLHKALTDSSQRLLLQPEDMIIVRYTFSEEVYNALLGMVQFNFLFNGGGL